MRLRRRQSCFLVAGDLVVVSDWFLLVVGSDVVVSFVAELVLVDDVTLEAVEGEVVGLSGTFWDLLDIVFSLDKYLGAVISVAGSNNWGLKEDQIFWIQQ